MAMKKRVKIIGTILDFLRRKAARRLALVIVQSIGEQLDVGRSFDAKFRDSIVRVAEFVWSRIEPSPGQFNRQWLDEVLEVFDRGGLKVIMAIRAANPPRWWQSGQFLSILDLNYSTELHDFFTFSGTEFLVFEYRSLKRTMSQFLRECELRAC